MIENFDKIRRWVWALVEALFQLILLCLLLYIVLGVQSGALVVGVAKNSVLFLNTVPQGTILALLAVYLVYLYLRHRRGS
jgi:membrane protein implicated in regulation of membrane protease activity